MVKKECSRVVARMLIYELEQWKAGDMPLPLKEFPKNERDEVMKAYVEGLEDLSRAVEDKDAKRKSTRKGWRK